MKEPILLKLAKLESNQQLYTEYKNGRVKLFKNLEDLTELQRTYLRWLEIVHAIKKDIMNQEKYAWEDILDSSLRIRAYLICKNKKIKRENEEIKHNKDNRRGKITQESIIFKRK